MKKIIFLFLVGVSCHQLFGQFAAGTGTAIDPYQISTPEQLNNVRDFPGTGVNFKLINDIDLTSYLSFTGAGNNNGTYWLPIADNSNAFSGTFNGNNHKITGLKSSHPSDFAVGLFSVVGSQGILLNIGITVDPAEYVDGASYVGGLVGYNSGTITGCYVTCEYQIAHGNYAGGLAGYNENGVITNCYVSGVTGGELFIGGLVGFNSGGTISKCYVVSEVGGVSHVGGLAGVNHNNGIISNCYSLAAVGGSDNVGGLVGDNLATIVNCYATGSVTGSTNYGGLVGNNSGGTVTKSFWDKGTTGMTTSSGSDNSFAKTTAEMKVQTTFTSWDFANEAVNGTASIWAFDANINAVYPILNWQINLATSTPAMESKQANLTLFPNPATCGFTIDAGKEFSEVSIFDLSGVLVLTQHAAGKSNIDISSLRAGMYVVKTNGSFAKLVKK